MLFPSLKHLLLGLFLFVGFNLALAQDTPPPPPKPPDSELPKPPPPPPGPPQPGIAPAMDNPAAPIPKKPTNKDEPIFKVVEQMPRFPGCEDMKASKHEIEICSKQKMLEYIYENLEYPQEAKKNEIEGTVVVRFTVAKDGHIRDIRLTEDIGYGCGEAAIKVFQSMNDLPERWSPGLQRQKPVAVLYTVPVRFAMPKE